jgi:hypothetical protein
MPLLFFPAMLTAFIASGQRDVPIGSWRLHLSYYNVQDVAVSPKKIFAATESAVLFYDRNEHTLGAYNKLNGLSNTGITAMQYAASQDQLLIGYEDGDLDLITPTAMVNFNRLRDAPVTSARTINDIFTDGNFAYLSTAYGVVVFDLQKLEIKETWRDLGPSGEELAVYATAVLRDSIYLATTNGVLAGKLHDNLLDFAAWKRFTSGEVSGAIHGLTTFNGKVYAWASNGVARLGDDVWVAEPLLPTKSIKSLTSSEKNLFAVSDSGVLSMNQTGVVSAITDDLLASPRVVQEDEEGNLWIGDAAAGLLSNAGGAFSAYRPNGPSMSIISKMVDSNGTLLALSGGFSPSGEPLGRDGIINTFEDGNWSTIEKSFSDITDAAVINGQTIISTFGSGVEKTDPDGNATIFDQTNSPLVNDNPALSAVTSLAASADGLWMANFGGHEPLHLLKTDGTWESHSFGFPNEQHPIDLTVDGSGTVWMALSPEAGGGLIAYDRRSNKAYYKTNTTGNGDLPAMQVRCVVTDREGYAWAGTDAGVAYFYSAGQDAIKPIYESRFLLRDEKITAIEVDGGNRKWIGTPEGVWLFNPTGESLVYHFTTENSPLLSGNILDIEINGQTGEVFFATDRGVISYRSDATEGAERFNELKIFPNPVYPGYSGTVGITGLSTNACVRITDISGKLIWQTQANGGTAAWNVRAQDGRRAATGVYLVFASSEDGTESVVGKIAVIE